MIKFIPKKGNGDYSKAKAVKKTIDLIVNNSLATQLNSETEFNCEIHPDKESIVSVSKNTNISFEIVSVCCEEFKEKLLEYLNRLT